MSNEHTIGRKLVAREAPLSDELEEGMTEIELKQYVLNFLNASTIPLQSGARKKLNYIDLFCGGGGLSLGVQHALRELGFGSRLLLAADLDQAALKLVDSHFKPLVQRNQSIEEMIRYSVDLSGNSSDFITKPIITDNQISQFKGKVDLLVGGPPCQGHSNLNNKTRRYDPRNLLYFTMPAFAVALDVPCVIIENVRSIKNASENVVEITQRILEENGYFVDETIIHGTDFGVAQTRTRHFLVATKHKPMKLASLINELKTPTLNFDDVNSDLPSITNYPAIMETPTDLSKENLMRIKHLHKTESFNLDNELRPDCHQAGHTYPSVYGRLKGDAPSGTITTGFGSPGRGRYIHPHEPRMITVREAARLQAFPDWYFAKADQLGLTKNNLYKIIGDAVPPLMVFPLIASIIGSFKEKLIGEKL